MAGYGIYSGYGSVDYTSSITGVNTKTESSYGSPPATPKVNTEVMGSVGRYIRIWLRATPLNMERSDTSLLSNLIDAIEYSDQEIGGSIK